ncbi:Hypothetical predicted protein, partial [Marmota monax]
MKEAAPVLMALQFGSTERLNTISRATEFSCQNLLQQSLLLTQGSGEQEEEE